MNIKKLACGLLSLIVLFSSANATDWGLSYNNGLNNPTII